MQYTRRKEKRQIADYSFGRHASPAILNEFLPLFSLFRFVLAEGEREFHEKKPI